jgi:hypothetical protein
VSHIESPDPGVAEQDRERRMQLLIRRFPPRVQSVVHWFRKPSSRWARIPAGIILIIGSLFSILPIFGLWMLPLGLVFIAEDVMPLRLFTGRVLAWIERRHPQWLGLSPASLTFAKRDF